MKAQQRRLKASRQRNTPQVCDMLLKISREVRALLELRSRVSTPRYSSPAQRPSQEATAQDDDIEITEDEAVQIAEKFLARRRGGALEQHSNVPLKSLTAQGISQHCPDKSANAVRLEDSK